MKIWSWIKLLPTNFGMEIAAIVIAPFAVLLDKVPTWMQTPDNPDIGDAGHQERWAGKPLYFQKVAWLWRNKAYGYKELNIPPTTFEVKYGDEVVSNRPWMPGWQVKVTPEGFWQFYAILPYGKRYARINLGWKLWEGANFGQYVATINPVAKQDVEVVNG